MVYKNSEFDNGICVEYQADKVSDNFLVELMASGGQNGHCPALQYSARCIYVGDNNSQILVQFYLTKPLAEAQAWCGIKKGVYADAAGIVDYKYPAFAKAIFRAIGDTSSSFCTEFNVENMDTVTINKFLADKYAVGNCPASTLDFGVCYTLGIGGAGVGQKTYYGGSILGPSKVGFQSSCELNGGIWNDLSLAPKNLQGPNNPPFSKAIFKAIGDTDSSFCTEFNVENMDASTLSKFVTDKYVSGNCPASTLDIGLCYTVGIGGLGVGQKTYYGGSILGSSKVGLQSSCEFNGGLWTSLNVPPTQLPGDKSPTFANAIFRAIGDTSSSFCTEISVENLDSVTRNKYAADKYISGNCPASTLDIGICYTLSAGTAQKTYYGGSTLSQSKVGFQSSCEFNGGVWTALNVAHMNLQAPKNPPFTKAIFKAIGTTSSSFCTEFSVENMDAVTLNKLVADKYISGNCPASTLDVGLCYTVGIGGVGVGQKTYYGGSILGASKIGLQSSCEFNEGLWTSLNVPPTDLPDDKSPVFSKAIYRAIGDTASSFCTEFNVENMDSVTLNKFLADNYAAGNCPSSTLDVGVCYSLGIGGTGVSQKTYYGGSILGASKLGLQSSCELNEGIWTSF